MGALDKLRDNERLVASKAANAVLVEQFRSLAAILRRERHERSFKSVMVASAAPGDEKSDVAINLALTLSDSYQQRVLLVDADLRHPSLHEVFNTPNTNGLWEALNATDGATITGFEISETLTLLPAGAPDRNPLSALSSDRMKRVVEDAAALFDWLIADPTSVGMQADGRLLAEVLDAAILVVRAGVTRFEDLEAAVDSIGRDRVLGIVLDGVEPSEIRGGNHYRHYYGRTEMKAGPGQ